MRKFPVSLYFGLASALFHLGCSRAFQQPTSPQAADLIPDVTSAQPLVYASQWGSTGTGQGQFEGIPAIACDSQSNIYVPDSSPECIQKFDSTGKFLMEWGNSGSGDSQFVAIVGICTDSNNNVYVYDNGSYSIKKFTSNGAYLTQWGSIGSGNGQFSSATRAIACDPSGNVYAVDAGLQKIQKFDGNGNFLTTWSTQGSWDTAASDPDGIACDQWGSVYTPDYNNTCVYKYSNTGTFQLQIGGPGTGPGKFGTLSCGVCVDSKGIVYVSDYAYGVVDEFNLQGKYLCQWGDTAPHALGNFDFFCVAPNGNAYVDYNDSVWIFEP